MVRSYSSLTALAQPRGGRPVDKGSVTFTTHRLVAEQQRSITTYLSDSKKNVF